MKNKTFITMPKLRRECVRVYSAPYCSLYYLLRDRFPRYYNVGVYGWNWDAYTFDTPSGRVAIVTGGRAPLNRKLPADVITRYETRAEAINERWRVGYLPEDERRDDLDALLREFLDELETLATAWGSDH